MQKKNPNKKSQAANFTYPWELRELISELKRVHDLSSTIVYLLSKEYNIEVKNFKMPYESDKHPSASREAQREKIEKLKPKLPKPTVSKMGKAALGEPLLNLDDQSPENLELIKEVNEARREKHDQGYI